MHSFPTRGLFLGLTCLSTVMCTHRAQSLHFEVLFQLESRILLLSTTYRYCGASQVLFSVANKFAQFDVSHYLCQKNFRPQQQANLCANEKEKFPSSGSFSLLVEDLLEENFDVLTSSQSCHSTPIRNAKGVKIQPVSFCKEDSRMICGNEASLTPRGCQMS